MKLVILAIHGCMCLHDTRVALTHISVIPSDHQKILSDLDACCHSLGFTIRPVKCFFFLVFDGWQVAKETKFVIGGGSTSSIYVSIIQFF